MPATCQLLEQYLDRPRMGNKQEKDEYFAHTHRPGSSDNYWSVDVNILRSLVATGNLEQKIRYKLWLMAFQFNLENRRLHFCNQLGDIHVDKWHSNRRWNWGQFCKFVAPSSIIFCALSVWIHKQTHSIFVDRHNTYILSLTSPKISNNQQ